MLLAASARRQRMVCTKQNIEEEKSNDKREQRERDENRRDFEQ